MFLVVGFCLHCLAVDFRSTISMQAIPQVPEKNAQQQVYQPVHQDDATFHHQQQQHQQPYVMGTVAPGYVRPNAVYQLPTQPISFWTTSLCSCMDDVDSGIESLFCNRCQMSRQYNVITYGINQVEPWTFLGSLVVDLFLGAPISAWAFTWYLRNRIRARYQIAGDDLNDCIVSSFANCCSTAQVYREMSLRGEWSAGCCIKAPFSLIAPPVPQMSNDVADNTVVDAQPMERIQ
jgi:Cys-rich protein (TIGR01571 family)